MPFVRVEPREEAAARIWVALALVLGETPVSDCVRACEELLPWRGMDHPLVLCELAVPAGYARRLRRGSQPDRSRPATAGGADTRAAAPHVRGRGRAPPLRSLPAILPPGNASSGLLCRWRSTCGNENGSRSSPRACLVSCPSKAQKKRRGSRPELRDGARRERRRSGPVALGEGSSAGQPRRPPRGGAVSAGSDPARAT